MAIPSSIAKLSSSSSMSITLIFLLSFMCLPLFSYSIKTVPIEEICSRHPHPDFCTETLKPKSGSDLHILGHYATMDVSHLHAFQTITDLHALIANTTNDPQMRQRYIKCAIMYDDIISRLQQASKDLDAGDYIDMTTSAVNVLKDVNDCDTEPPLNDPTSIPKNNKDLEGTTLIIVIIAGFLGRNSF